MENIFEVTTFFNKTHFRRNVVHRSGRGAHIHQRGFVFDSLPDFPVFTHEIEILLPKKGIQVNDTPLLFPPTPSKSATGTINIVIKMVQVFTSKQTVHSFLKTG